MGTILQFKFLVLLTALAITQSKALPENTSKCNDEIHQDLRGIKGWDQLILPKPFVSKNSKGFCKSLEGIPNCCNQGLLKNYIVKEEGQLVEVTNSLIKYFPEIKKLVKNTKQTTLTKINDQFALYSEKTNEIIEKASQETRMIKKQRLIEDNDSLSSLENSILEITKEKRQRQTFLKKMGQKAEKLIKENRERQDEILNNFYEDEEKLLKKATSFEIKRNLAYLISKKISSYNRYLKSGNPYQKMPDYPKDVYNALRQINGRLNYKKRGVKKFKKVSTMYINIISIKETIFTQLLSKLNIYDKNFQESKLKYDQIQKNFYENMTSLPQRLNIIRYRVSKSKYIMNQMINIAKIHLGKSLSEEQKISYLKKLQKLRNMRQNKENDTNNKYKLQLDQRSKDRMAKRETILRTRHEREQKKEVKKIIVLLKRRKGEAKINTNFINNYLADDKKLLFLKTKGYKWNCKSLLLENSRMTSSIKSAKRIFKKLKKKDRNFYKRMISVVRLDSLVKFDKNDLKNLQMKIKKFEQGFVSSKVKLDKRYLHMKKLIKNHDKIIKTMKLKKKKYKKELSKVRDKMSKSLQHTKLILELNILIEKANIYCRNAIKYADENILRVDKKVSDYKVKMAKELALGIGKKKSFYSRNLKKLI